ncbi:hypothetical protein P255_01010 [Acinetobacter brisouii CIP 110357]|uniref:Uncharacterized protein n=1 Tax=Acinetobacter brisouii CIP 110357 TaxID=1341683 RepID=V2UTE5_9GAMM|nr:hypothetical protein [Acinetobacter brisouii]ENV48131.1 hypothetical protein F954_01198 [Acinetobacter brisouii ANC 4119]ESK51915.1 hypothetical protein P255_01010 [Acinetobacter brisouii CIP 110357]
MYSKNNILLPTKSAYSLEEACKELNLFFNRDDIDIEYVLDLVHQGHIWLHAKFSKDNDLFALPIEWELDQKFDNKDEQAIAEIIFFNKMLTYQNIYNGMGDYDLFLKLSINSAFDFLNNKNFTTPIIVDIYDPCERFYLFENYLKPDSSHNIELKVIPENFNRNDFLNTVLINHSTREYIKKILGLKFTMKFLMELNLLIDTMNFQKF